MIGGFFVVMIGHAHTGGPNPEGVGYQASTEDKNGAWQLGVPGVVINIFGHVEVYGPERRQGGYAGNPGFPNEAPLIDLGEPQWGPH
jgi:hypothetical protein